MKKEEVGVNDLQRMEKWKSGNGIRKDRQREADEVSSGRRIDTAAEHIQVDDNNGQNRSAETK